jgi:site-specific recombinase XerD
MSAVGFRRMLTRLGKAPKMPFGIHPHMLRHSTGFKLANQGVDTRSLQHYLGHKNIQHTVRWELTPERFRDFLERLDPASGAIMSAMIKNRNRILCIAVKTASCQWTKPLAR